jgi:ubiquinone/menaquinone biosynthesis C-methylase UbiE/uncharacterized protein YbaR (Trm112 family)
VAPTPTGAEMDATLLPLLVCPRHRLPLRLQDDNLVCKRGDRYAVVEGIPILLLSEATQTHVEGTRSLEVAKQGSAAVLPQFDVQPGTIDPFVQRAIGATNGSLYQHLVGNMTEYPIPHLRLPAGEGKLFLEIGCSWGRWCIAAARQGYQPIGVDPSLKGIRAARRVAAQLGIKAHYVVADGRHLPFSNEVFSQVFSYSVLQHISRDDARKTLIEIQRVLRQGGGALVQMPNTFGIRCLYHQVRRRFREARDFEVRYWRPRQLLSTFSATVGPSRLSVDGYFSLNPQFSDLRFLPMKYQALVRLSEILRRASQKIFPLAYFADSLYVSSLRSQRPADFARPVSFDPELSEIEVNSPLPATVAHDRAS